MLILFFGEQAQALNGAVGEGGEVEHAGVNVEGAVLDGGGVKEVAHEISQSGGIGLDVGGVAADLLGGRGGAEDAAGGGVEGDEGDLQVVGRHLQEAGFQLFGTFGAAAGLRGGEVEATFAA